jgi:large subunit ribosomal protein L4
MTSLPIYDKTGKEVGTYQVDIADIAPRITKQLLHEAVIMYRSNQRQGTHRTKTRSEVAGTTKKMYRQKGTGNARAGSRRSGIRRGGGHIHAVRPRDYSYKMPRKAAQAATRMAIATKIQDGQLVIVNELSASVPKTKEIAGLLKALKLNELTTLVTTADYDVNVYKSARNIRGVTISPVKDLNAYEVLKPSRMVVSKAALDSIVEAAKKVNANKKS